MIGNIKHKILMILVLILFLPVLSIAGTVNLPQTGQTKCYDILGNEIPCTGTGQDGDIQAGVAWPSPRFNDNGDGTITDNLTGLMWTQDAGTPTIGACTGGTMTWQNALNYVACLNTNNYLGHNDWRLTNSIELESVTNIGAINNSEWLVAQGFINLQLWYRSSTTLENDTDSAWMLDMSGERLVALGKSDSNFYYAWPVRGGLSERSTTAAIPTLTEWGMIIFIILAGLGSVYYLRRQRRA